MKLILALLITLPASTGFAASHSESKSYLTDGTVYTFKMVTTAEDRWDSKRQDHPPLSPKRAQEVAGEFMKKVPAGEKMSGWEVTDISLHRFGRSEEWVYSVKFAGVPDSSLGVWNGPVSQFDVPVRLNGKIPEWKLEKRERRK